jgi:hypothetical protein
MAKTKTINIPAIPVNKVHVRIAGDTDLIINKMDRRTKDDLLRKQSGKPKITDPHNDWEDAATSIHWNIPVGDIKTEDDFNELFEKGKPCISAFGLQKALSQAVSRFGLDAKGTVFNANVQVFAENGLIPVDFKERFLDEDIIPSNTLAKTPVRQFHNRFVGWTADIVIRYVDNGQLTLEQILQIVGLAGVGIGVGSGKSSGFGRFHIASAWE